MGLKESFKSLFSSKQVNLSNSDFGDRHLETEAGATDNSIAQTNGKNKYLPYELKAVYRTRKDIADWNASLSMAQALYPINYPLQKLYDEILIDALLTSQVENRINQTLSSIFNLKLADGSIDEAESLKWRNSPLYKLFIKAIFDKKFRGNRVIELKMDKGIDGEPMLTGDFIPCTNVVQQTGLFYPDYYNTGEYIKYRELPEFGTWILEFDNKDFGLLNKAVPHVLFQRFAQSCWSELCEIYGTPPRVMKTNTQDPVMLQRATKMMKDMGNAAWFIIDDNESFEWAKGMTTNGDVYSGLMNMCRDHICLLISGAIIGQDTRNGGRSKDQAAQEMLWLLVQSDQSDIEIDFNTIILPVLKKHGVIAANIASGAFEPSEDIPHLWDMTIGALQFYNVDPEWVKTKFGIEITGERAQPQKANGGEPTTAENLSFKIRKGFFA